MVTPNKDLANKLLTSSGFTKFLSTYNTVLTIVLGMVTLLVLTLLCINIAKLSASASDERKRKEAISGILTCLICLAITGGIDVVYAILLSITLG